MGCNSYLKIENMHNRLYKLLGIAYPFESCQVEGGRVPLQTKIMGFYFLLCSLNVNIPVSYTNFGVSVGYRHGSSSLRSCHMSLSTAGL